MMSLPWYDWLGLGFFALTFFSYSWLIERSPWAGQTLSRLMAKVRRDWFIECLNRGMRMPDGLIMGMQQTGAAYFGSASLLGIGAGFTLVTASDSLPAVLFSGGQGLTVKALMLMLMFALAFFQFAWAYRLFGYNAISLGAIPQDTAHPRAHHAAQRAAALNVVAGQHFNQAVRLFLFSIPLVFWLVSVWALVLTTAGLTLIMVRRQFLTSAQLEGLALAWDMAETGKVDEPSDPA